MKLAFLYPGGTCFDAIDGWVRALARFCPTTEIVLSRSLDDCLAHQPDAALCVTEATCHPGKVIDHELAVLIDKQIPCGVLWNNDVNGPTPGDWPSFVWTQRSFDNLKAAYKPILRRQPVFPARAIAADEDAPLLAGTFGAVEPKKQIGPLWDWARKHDVPFRAFGPDSLVRDNDWYIADLRLRGCPVTIHPWLPRVEDLAHYLKDVTHFLFVLPESKGGTGGSPTSPRYAGLFNRPVIVVDDEMTYAQDGFYVCKTLEGMGAAGLSAMTPPAYHWSPERYVTALLEDTFRFWDVRRGEAWYD